MTTCRHRRHPEAGFQAFPYLAAVALRTDRDVEVRRRLQHRPQLAERTSALLTRREIRADARPRGRLFFRQREREELRLFDLRHGSPRSRGRSARLTFATARNTLWRAAAGVCPSAAQTSSIDC